MDEANTCASWPASAKVRRTSSCRSSRTSRPPMTTRPRSGSRKRRKRFVTVVLPAPLGPTSATRCPGSMVSVTPSRAAGPSPYRAVTSSSATATGMLGAGTGVTGSVIAGSAAGQLEDARAGCEGRRKLACGCRERRHRVERRQGEQRERRHQHAIERPRVVRGDGERQHADECQAGDEHQGCVGDAGDECVAAGRVGGAPRRRTRLARTRRPPGRRRPARALPAGSP